MVAMVAPSMDKAALASALQARLQKLVLSWDYVCLFSESKPDQKKLRKKKSASLRTVPTSFRDAEEYLSVFEPLLFEEIKAHILRGEEEGDLSWEMAAVTKCDKAHDFYFVQAAVQLHVVEKLTENDLILLSKEKFQEESVFPSTYAFASLEGREGKQTLKLRMFLDGEFDGLTESSLSHSGRLSKMRTALQIANSAWWLIKLSNFSTIMREYTALQSVRTLPFGDVILSGQPQLKEAEVLSQLEWNVPPKLMHYLEESLNESQLEAIKAGLTRNPLILIQGPPGTGKTQTILGLLSVILHATPARILLKGNGLSAQERPELPFTKKMEHWWKASPWLGGTNPRDTIMPMDGDDGFFPTSKNEFRPETVGTKRKHRVHVLVCAPSNSALDEIVLRLINTGLHDENGDIYIPSVVRIGVNAHHSIQSVSMDHMVEQRLSSMDRSTASSGPRAGNSGRERERIRLAVLEEAAIVCSTLSFSGAGVFHRMNRGFDVVVIDEAAQAVEPSTLVPLAHGCKQVFLVGDPLQLPATVLSSVAVQHGYSMSLFKRLQQTGYPVQMLRTQYRMHPEIREFPSKEFYGDSLEDGKDVALKTSQPWHEHRCFGPFAFFDIAGEETQPDGSGSWVNNEEVEFILLLYRHLLARFPQLKAGPHIAIISPYKLQVKLLRERFRELIGADAARLIDINTVDGFQGREKDVAIFSCVRSNESKGIGFVSDFRRMNVGLTRARASMLVVGSASSLMQDKHWKNLVMNVQQRNRFFKVSKPYHSIFSEESLAAMKKLDVEEAERKKSLNAEGRIEKGCDFNDDTLQDDFESNVEELMEATENFGEFEEDDEV